MRDLLTLVSTCVYFCSAQAGETFSVQSGLLSLLTTAVCSSASLKICSYFCKCSERESGFFFIIIIYRNPPTHYVEFSGLPHGKNVKDFNFAM